MPAQSLPPAKAGAGIHPNQQVWVAVVDTRVRGCDEIVSRHARARGHPRVAGMKVARRHARARGHPCVDGNQFPVKPARSLSPANSGAVIHDRQKA